jgi:CheY-like chemotaxis protein
MMRLSGLGPLIISDYMMPVLDGAGMLKAMRNTEAQRDIPCIVMSSLPEPSVRAHITDIVAFVRKPFRLTDIMELVAAVLGAPQAPPK